MHIPRTLFTDSEAQERAFSPEALVFLTLDLKPVLATVQPPDSGREWCPCDFPDTGRVFSDMHLTRAVMDRCGACAAQWPLRRLTLSLALIQNDVRLLPSESGHVTGHFRARRPAWPVAPALCLLSRLQSGCVIPGMTRGPGPCLPSLPSSPQNVPGSSLQER